MRAYYGSNYYASNYYASYYYGATTSSVSTIKGGWLPKHRKKYEEVRKLYEKRQNINEVVNDDEEALTLILGLL